MCLCTAITSELVEKLVQGFDCMNDRAKLPRTKTTIGRGAAKRDAHSQNQSYVH